MASHVRSLVESVARGRAIKVESTLTVNRPIEELYRFWRDFENLPRFLLHLKSVKALDEVNSRWILGSIVGAEVALDTTIHNEIPNELIAWSSLEGADIKLMGAAYFRPAPTNRGTELRVMLSYEPPPGRLSRLLGRLFGKDPSLHVRSELRRFKALLETGEIPTTEGQSSGRWEAPKPLPKAAPQPALATEHAWDASAHAEGRMS